MNSSSFDSTGHPRSHVEPWANSPAKKKLAALFRAGKIKVDTPPLAIWHSDPVFQQYNINNFRNNYSRLKKKELLAPVETTRVKKEIPLDAYQGSDYELETPRAQPSASPSEYLRGLVSISSSEEDYDYSYREESPTSSEDSFDWNLKSGFRKIKREDDIPIQSEFFFHYINLLI